MVQAMRAASKGRGRQRSPAFEVRTTAPESSAASLKKLLRQARASGSLNLTSRSLEQVPEQVFNLIGKGAELLCTTAKYVVIERGRGSAPLYWLGVALCRRCMCVHHRRCCRVQDSPSFLGGKHDVPQAVRSACMVPRTAAAVYELSWNPGRVHMCTAHIYVRVTVHRPGYLGLVCATPAAIM